MIRLLNILITGLILSSCSFSKKDIIILKTLDQFPTEEENKQLGNDLLNYGFESYLPEEFPDLTEAELKNITWQYFVQSGDNKISFRLILTNEAINRKDQLRSFFEKIVNEQVEKQVKDKELFNRSVLLATAILKQLDNKEFDLFWDQTGDLLRSKATKDDFFKILKNRETIISNPEKRIFQSKLYYRTLTNVIGTDFYSINFAIENDKKIIEQLTFQLVNNKELKIVGYTWAVQK